MLIATAEKPKRLGDQRLRDRFPMLFAFGPGPHKFLTVAQCKKATFEERMQSVWPYIVNEVVRFYKSLRPRDQAAFDPEDILSELWVAVKTKDHQWEPDRGKYVSFVAQQLLAVLSDIRSRCSGLQMSRNIHWRAADYGRRGELTKESQATYTKMLRAIGEIHSIETDDIVNPVQVSESERLDSENEVRSVIRRILARLPNNEAYVLHFSTCANPMTAGKIAKMMRMKRSEVVRVRDRVIDSICKELGIRCATKFKSKKKKKKFSRNSALAPCAAVMASSTVST